MNKVWSAGTRTVPAASLTSEEMDHGTCAPLENPRPSSSIRMSTSESAARTDTHAERAFAWRFTLVTASRTIWSTCSTSTTDPDRSALTTNCAVHAPSLRALPGSDSTSASSRM